jgi:hypothetical protein
MLLPRWMEVAGVKWCEGCQGYGVTQTKPTEWCERCKGSGIEPRPVPGVENLTEAVNVCPHSSFSICFACRLPRAPMGELDPRACEACRKGEGLCHCQPLEV